MHTHMHPPTHPPRKSRSQVCTYILHMHAPTHPGNQGVKYAHIHEPPTPQETKEPEIFHAIRFGTILENVVFSADKRTVRR